MYSTEVAANFLLPKIFELDALIAKLTLAAGE